MAIAARRFNFLDRETNVPVVDFSTVKTSAVYNGSNAGDIGLTQDIEDFVTNSTQAVKIAGKEVDSSVRAAKGALGSIKDLTKASNEQMQKIMGGMFPGNPQAQSVFNTLATKCKTTGMNNFNLGKPYDLDVDCGGKKRKGAKGACNSAGFNDVLNKLTDGEYKAQYSNYNEILRGIVALSKIGYNLNMCGVFNAVKGTQGINLLSRASGSLLGTLGAAGNTLGVLDVAGSSVGLHPLRENPSAIKTAFTGFTIPKEVKQNTYPEFSDRYTGAMELLDDKWDKSKEDGIMSISNAPLKHNDLNNVLKSKAVSKSVFDEDHLDVVSNDSSLYLASAYGSIGKQASGWASLV